VRPPDENQHGSNRPNLMSASRRAAGGEDNILAKLERDAPRGLPGMLSGGARLAWFGIAGLLILTLIGALAWLARENARVHRFPLAVAPSRSAPLPLPAAPAASVVAAAAAPAAIIDEAPERAERPTLVMLPAAAPPLAIAPAVRPALPKPAALAAKPAVRPVPARARKAQAPAAPPKTEAAGDDTDIALLSAIIMHSSSHAAERAQQEAGTCPAGKKCAPKAGAEGDAER
jgi:hypothetical protein